MQIIHKDTPGSARSSLKRADAYIPSSLGKQEREQIKTLIGEYEKRAEDATLRAADVRDFSEYKRLMNNAFSERKRRPALEAEVPE